MKRINLILMGCIATLLPLLLAACAATSTGESSLSRDGLTLDQWIKTDLDPYLKDKLVRHPRFKGEPLLVVSMDGDQRRTPADRLSGKLVQAITKSLLDTGDVNLVWKQNPVETSCPSDVTIHYYLGVDIVSLENGVYQVSVRALDLEDNSWVRGFGKQWQGRLNRSQRNALTRREPQNLLPGTRDKPFADSQADLLAEQLAKLLARKYCGHVGEPLRIMPIVTEGNPPVVAKTVTLVGNYLAESHNLNIVDEPARANVLLSGKLVQIDNKLHQLWLQLRPGDSDAEMQVVNLQAYVQVTPHRNTRYVAKKTAEPASYHSQKGLLSSVRVVTPIDRRRCKSTDPWRQGWRFASGTDAVRVDSCFAFDIVSRRDAHVFLLAHNRDAQLVRLLPNNCDRYGRASNFARHGRKLRIPSRNNGRRHAFAGGTGHEFEDFYVVAVANRAKAEAILGHVLGTADVCSPAESLRNSSDWLTDLEKLITTLGSDGGWHRVQVTPMQRVIYSKT